MHIKSIRDFNTEKAMQAINNKEKIIFSEPTIILASKSVSRKRIMEQAGISFVVLPSIADEDKIKGEFPVINTEELACKYVKKLAYEKAKALADYVENGIIIAADTIAFCDNEKLEKPVDKEDARRILTKISGSKHVAITGVCIIKDRIVDNFSETSFVEMDKFETEKIEELVNNPNTYLYAGGYCIDDNIEGYAHVAPEDYNNVMGLPLQTITLKLKID
jgi:septum formation protein